MDELNDEVRSAIESAVKKLKQPPEVAKRIGALLGQIANGNVNMNKRDEYQSHLEAMLDVIVVDNGEENRLS